MKVRILIMMMSAISDRLANTEGKVGVVYINLTTGQRLFCGNCRKFKASGIVLLMALVECFKAMEEGRIKRDQIYRLNLNTVRISTKSSYGVLNHLHDGIELTIEDLYKVMITVSDNIAFNVLVDILGMENINETFRSLGFPNMIINRKIYDLEKMAQGIENSISIEDVATIYERMYKGQLISEAASKEMLELLALHQRSNIIPYPFHECMDISHLTGVDDDILLDGGIVYTEKPFILSLAATDMDAQKAEILLRDITQICYVGTMEEV